MVRKVDPAVVAEVTQTLAERISGLIVPKDDPRSSFGFNLWFKQGPISVYMRQGRRINAATREWVYTLEIASIDVKERAQRKGYFTSFLNQMENIAARRGMNILIENVHNEALEAFLVKRSYSLYRLKTDPGGWPPTYWLV